MTLHPYDRKYVQHMLFRHKSRPGKRFDKILMWVIVASVITVMLESIHELNDHYAPLFNVLEWIFTAIFSVEYIARVWAAPDRKKYIFSFWGFIDFISLIPTYFILIMTSHHQLLVIRALRLLRALRILNFTRQGLDTRILYETLRASSHKITVFMTFVMTIVIIMGASMYVVEGGRNGFSSIPMSIYWAVVTVTTVGYGDIVPQTAVGKLLSSIMMLMGYAVLAFLSGIFTVELTKTVRKEEEIRCKSCGEEIPEDSAFCNRCGAKVDHHISRRT